MKNFCNGSLREAKKKPFKFTTDSAPFTLDTVLFHPP